MVGSKLEMSAELLRWAETWRRASVALARIEREEAAELDVGEVLEQLRPAFTLARRAEPVTSTSGLVEMRRLLDRRHG